MPAPGIGDCGEYRAFTGCSLPQNLTLVFIPSLATLLMRAQELAGAALTETQVLRIRDAAKVMIVGTDAARAMREERGYADIDPASAWPSWLAIAPPAG